MHIQGDAENLLPHFRWLIEVENTQEIMCGDVLDTIARMFPEHVTEEYNSWTTHRKTGYARVYRQRARTPHVDSDEVPDGWVHPSTTWGERVIFHGLE